MIKKGLLIILVCICTTGAFAQKSTQDFQTWYDAELKLNLKKGWELSGQYRTRFDENSSHYKGSYFFLSGEKKLNKYFKVLGNYRLALVNGNNYHRLLIGANAQFKVNDFTFFTRPMAQTQTKYFAGDDENRNGVTNYLRLRTGVKYKISKHWDTYVYAEPFLPFKEGKLSEINFWQNNAGISYEYKKNKSVTLYYSWQPEVNKKHPDTINVLGLSFDFEVKPNNKKSKKEKKSKDG
ncbi:hypothetical protein GCM10027442_33220 [Emticicia fontis]